MKNFFKFTFYVSVITILYLATTTLEIKAVSNSWDKLNHFVAFFTLYVLLSFSYENLKIELKVLILTLFGFMIEVIQYFIPNREFSLFDVFADIVGIFIGVLLFSLYSNRFKPNIS